MKGKLITSLLSVIFLFGIGMMGTSCSKDDGLQMEPINITVNKADWKWNSSTSQWEAIFDLPELTEYIYEKGAQIAYVFIGTQGQDEVQKLLPYVNTYSAGNDANGNPIYFTETISCDYQLGNPSSVAFFIKSSDLYQDADAPQTYNFRIVLVW